jgi:adenylate cyclase
VRKSISLKIFSIALVIIALMALVSGISANYLDRVSDEALELSRYYLPLSQRANMAARHASAEVVHFELALHLRSAGASATAVEAELKSMRERSALADKAIEESLALVARGEADAEIDINSRDFSQVRIELPQIVAAHRDLAATMESYLKSAAGDSATTVLYLEDQITRQRANLTREIGDVTMLLDRLAADSANQSMLLEARAGRLTWGLTAAAIAIGLILAAAITRSLVRPVRDLVAGTKAIQDGDLNVRLAVTTSDEIASLAHSFNHMVGGLKQKEVIQNTFGKYVDPRIVKNLIENEGLAQAGMKRRMTMFFSDIEGFTSLSERLPAEQLVEFLNRYFSAMAGAVREENGIIDKYIGDAIMAFWGPPFVEPAAQAGHACRTALAQMVRLDQMRGSDTAFPVPLTQLNVRIGIATGEVTVGSIGSDSQKNYTVVGDPVNLASRLESANKLYGTNVIVCETTYAMAGNEFETRQLDRIRVVGKNEPVTIFELLGMKGQCDPARLALRDAFEAALAHFRASDMPLARLALEKCLAIDERDKSVKLLLDRIALVEKTGLPDGWDGAWTLSDK